MVTLIDIQLLQLNKLSSKLSSNQALVAVACSHKHKLNNKLQLVMESTLTTEEQQLQLNSSNNNNNKQQQQDSRKFLVLVRAMALWQRFLAMRIVINILQRCLAMRVVIIIWLK